MTFTPPNSQEAEMAVIGSVLIDDQKIDSVKDFLSPDDFYNTNLGKVYELMLKMRKEGVAIDQMTMRHRDLKLVVEADIKECILKVSTANNVFEYARTVARLSIERSILCACRNTAAEPTQENMEKVAYLVNARDSLYSAKTYDYDVRLGQLIDELYDKKSYKTIKTGFAEIDRNWWSLRPGEVNVWGGATNVGKSLILLNLAERAVRRGDKCLFVGTEMTAQETVQRHLSMISGVEPWKIRTPKLEKSDFEKLHKAVSDKMFGLPMSIYDSPEPTIEDVDRIIASIKPTFVFMDYLERFSLPKDDSMRLRVKEFMRRLKSIARSRGVIIHLASQLNRTAYDDEKPPNMSQLSESSAVEKEADRVMLFWTPKSRQAIMPEGKRIIEVIQAKNRHGKNGLTFDFILDEKNLTIKTQEEIEDDHNGTDKGRSAAASQGELIRAEGRRPGGAEQNSGTLTNKQATGNRAASHGLGRKDQLAADGYQKEDLAE